MKTKRIISAFLTLVMLLGSLTVSIDAAWADKVNSEGAPLISYTTKLYESPEAKLKDMEMVLEEGGYQLWFEWFTGEVAVKDMSTGQVWFTNPIDIAAEFNTGAKDATIAGSQKAKLLSQLIITYLQNDQLKTMFSYTEAAQRGQITMTRIKGGIRVSYVMGEEHVTRLVPRMIEKSRFEQLILDKFGEENEFYMKKLKDWYVLYDKDDPTMSERAVAMMQAKYPVTLEKAVYICEPTIGAKDLRKLEDYIKQYCPEYTYEELDYDHESTGYEGNDEAPPRFRMSLEYKINEYGVEVRLPANGIEFDESAFQFKEVSILPYFGASSNEYTGYSVIPDGSGSIIRFEDFIGTSVNISSSIYGSDYAYHEITGQHSETMRMPYFGLVVNYEKGNSQFAGLDSALADKLAQKEAEASKAAEESKKAAQESAAASKAEAEAAKTETDKDGKPVVVETETEIVTETETEYVPKITAEENGSFKYQNAFLAIVTEGDSLASLMAECGGSVHPYSTVYAKFTPRPSDVYNLSDSISVSGNATWTVTSKRKYTDNYRIQYIFMKDAALAEKNNVEDFYESSWVGMATAYRDYLTNQGVLSKMDNTGANIPIVIETFGSLKTVERKFSFPVTVDKPLTTFEDIKTMFGELSGMGVSNMNFKLTGYANGGMNALIPYNLKWNEVVGGAEGFTDLAAYAQENGFELYPDFDFAYIRDQAPFDGVDFKTDAIRTIDNRYTTRRVYNPSTQTFIKTSMVAVSPSVYEYLYETFGPNYQAYGNDSIAVSTLGTDLNSDFDEDEPYHREDSKNFTTDLLASMDADYNNIMVEGGNAYTIKYADVITGASLTSSNFVKTSQSIPFQGMVYHGSKVLTGSAINMEGDMDEYLLHTIENGAYLYFILSYQNTSLLKEDPSLSQYYSVSYDIWRDDVAEYYQKLNDATKDLQTAYIVDHEFLDAERIPDADELEADKLAKEEAEAAAAEKAAAKLEKEERAKRLAERLAAQYGLNEETEEETTAVETDENGDPIEVETDENGEPVEVETDENGEPVEVETDENGDPVEVETDENGEPVEVETDENGEPVETNEFGEVIVEEEKEEKVVVLDKYKTTVGSVVRVEYEGGVNFILNYNSYDITVEYEGTKYEIGSLDFVRIN